jgi:ATP-dependent Zn protease
VITSTDSYSQDVALLANEHVMAGKADVSAARERTRLRKFIRLGIILTPIATWFVYRAVIGHPIHPGWPAITMPSSDTTLKFAPIVLTVVLVGGMLLVMLRGGSGSPHQVVRSSDITTRLDDVRGLGNVKTEVVNTLNLFLGHKTYARVMGGTARRGILFEGPPGTGKTLMAKAMAGEAGVPYLFVNASAFQSKFYGATGGKIRSFFKALRKAARKEGGAIGFIEEIDAIGASRSGMGSSHTEGISGVVNELLVQMQSFDEPTKSERFTNWWIGRINFWLPHGRQIPTRKPTRANILVIAATNRAADLDPALVRPGRFDRTVSFDPPDRAGRADILDYYLAKKAHTEELDDPIKIGDLASMTMGYTPVQLENLLDESLIVALRRGAAKMSWDDVMAAKLTVDLGLTSPAGYSEAERRAIATHEAGHATVAYVVGKSRKLEVLSIQKRKEALGMLVHSDLEERFTRTKSEYTALIQIAFGGMAAEEQFFGDVSSGPSGDLSTATTIAAQMIGVFGMGSTLISLHPTLTPGVNLVSKVLSDDQSREQVEALLAEAKAEAVRIIAEYTACVEALRDALLESGELIGPEITGVIEAALGTMTSAPVQV